MLDVGAVHLRSGEKYLVFASQNTEHILQISYLSIIPPSLAASEIRFLHAQREKDAPKTMLYGTLLQPMGDQDREHLIATRIDANGPSGSFQAVTDPDGYFEFRNIPVGKYQVTPELPDMLAASSYEVTIKEGGCAAVPLMAVWNGRISGCARRSDGQPIADANVSLIDLARKRGEGIAERTDEGGCYQFEHLESGRYVVGLLDMDDPSDDYPFPPMFYPNAVSPELASVLELAKGEKLDNVDFAVQDFEPRLLRVQVLWPNRRPAADAHVFIEYEQSYCWKMGCVLAYFTTHQDGRVTFYGYGRGRVRVYAVAKHSSGKEWISGFKELRLADLPFATTLTISGPNDYNAVGR